MTKWEYMYVEAWEGNIELINEQKIGELKSLFSWEWTGRPSISKFLEKVGQEGWEVVGMGSGEIRSTKLILKRPIP